MGKRSREKSSERESSSPVRKKCKYEFFKGKLPVLNVHKASKKIKARSRAKQRVKNPAKRGFYFQGYNYKLRDTVGDVK